MAIKKIGGAYFEEAGGKLSAVADPAVLSKLESGELKAEEASPTGAQFASKVRQPGESLESFVQRLDGKAPETGTGTPYAPPAPVVTSEAERIKERAKAFKEGLGIGEPPSLVDLFGPTEKEQLQTARTERATIQTESEKILEDKLTLEEELRKFKVRAPQGVPEAGRAGLISEEERGFQERFDALNRRELVLETKLRNRNTIIGEMMGLQKEDFSNAVQRYNTQFSNAISFYNIVDKEMDELKKNAKANLDVYSKAIQDNIQAGKFKFEDVSPLQKSKIEELELQAGYPAGATLASLQALKPNEEKLYSGVDSNGNFHLISKDTQGKITHRQIEGVGTAGVSDDIKEYNFYVSQERATGQTPVPFLEYMQTKGKSTTEDPEIVQELKDAQSAIDAGADADAVRKRFMQKYPNKGDLFLKYFKYEF